MDLSYSLFHSFFFSELFIIPYSFLLDIHYSVSSLSSNLRARSFGINPGLAEKTIEQTTETMALVLKTKEVDESGSK